MTERPQDPDDAPELDRDDPVIAADGPAEHGPPDDIDPDLKRRKGG